MSAGIATQNEVVKVESMNDKGKALEPESTTQPNKSDDGCKSKPKIDESRVSADGSSTDEKIQAERQQEITPDIAIQFRNRLDSS